MTKNSAAVGWVKPMRDGGAKIDGYVIEYIEVKPPPEPPAPAEVCHGIRLFFLCFSLLFSNFYISNLQQVPEGEEAPPPPPPDVEDDQVESEKEVWNTYTTVKGLSISVSGLKEGKRYKFRVAAKNIMGLSSFTETREPVEIKEQMCKLLESVTCV